MQQSTNVQGTAPAPIKPGETEWDTTYVRAHTPCSCARCAQAPREKNNFIQTCTRGVCARRTSLHQEPSPFGHQRGAPVCHCEACRSLAHTDESPIICSCYKCRKGLEIIKRRNPGAQAFWAAVYSDYGHPHPRPYPALYRPGSVRPA
jgi:hypothetical protein